MSCPNLALDRPTRATPPPSDPSTDTAIPETATTQTATADAATREPATTDPATTDPATTDPATTDPATTGPATTDPATTDPANEALAAIASTYEDARAGIISGDSSAPEPEQAPRSAAVPVGHSPTVPLTLMTSLKAAAPATDSPDFADTPEAPDSPDSPDSPAGARQAAAALWSRLLRRGEPVRRGRHSATESESLVGEAFQWGPPGRVRFLS